MRGLSEKEKEVLRLSGELWNQFIELPTIHPDDNNDVRFHIHAIQNIVFARPAFESQKEEK